MLKRDKMRSVRAGATGVAALVVLLAITGKFETLILTNFLDY